MHELPKLSPSSCFVITITATSKRIQKRLLLDQRFVISTNYWRITGVLRSLHYEFLNWVTHDSGSSHEL